MKKGSERIVSGPFVLLSKPNQIQVYRLGIALSKCSSAVQRNYLKRIVKEMMRVCEKTRPQSKQDFGRDFLFLTSKNADWNKTTKIELKKSLAILMGSIHDNSH